MSRPVTTLGKIKLFIAYLKDEKEGIIIDCGFCKSTNIHFCEDKVVSQSYSTVYKSKYLCNNCGSICNNRQEWFQRLDSK